MEEKLKKLSLSAEDLENYCEREFGKSLEEKTEERKNEFLLKLLLTVAEEKETERQIMTTQI